MKKLESQLQQHCIRYFKYAFPNIVIFAIPNEGKRSVKTASRMKAEGMLAGVADMMICHVNDEYHGLFIEMKYGKGKQTESQQKFEGKITTAGYRYVICRSFDEFQDVIMDYMRPKKIKIIVSD